MSEEKYECERQLVKEKRTHLMFLEKLASLGVNSSASRSRFHLSRKVFSMACSAMLLGSTALSSQALALSLPKGQKKGNLQLPLNTRLEDGLDSGSTTSSTSEQ
jgi:hypothetical protein